MADERNRPDVKLRCQRWKRLQSRADPRKLVFIDETWMKTNMSSKHSSGLKGRW